MDDKDIKKSISLKAEIMNCMRKKVKLGIVEDISDKKIYTDKVFVKDDNYNFRPVRYFGKGSGCTAIIRLLNENKEYLDKLEEGGQNNYIKGIIDSDAWKYRKKHIKREENIKSIEKYLIILKRYNIESYGFEKECLKEILFKYMNATKEEISNVILQKVYNIVKVNSTEDAYMIGILCLGNEKGLFNSEFSFGVNNSNQIISACKKRKIIIDKEKKNYDKEIKMLIQELNLKKDWNTVTKIINGKHLRTIVASEIKDIINEMNKGKLCDESSTSIKEISCTLEQECDDTSCKFNTRKNLNLKNMDLSIDIEDKFDSEEISQLRNEIISQF